MEDIRDEAVPTEVRRHWERRAQAAGLPLDEYLLRKMLRETQRPTNAEIFEKINRTATGHLSPEEAVEAQRELRESR
jgi:hypothetical protein